MKVVFLDNDGVVCLHNNWGTRNKKRQKAGVSARTSPSELSVDLRFDNLDKKAVRILNEILEESGAEYVVSSDWRFHATLEELGDYYLSQGVVKRPLDATGMFKDLFPKQWASLRFRADLELERYMEVENWLEKHPEVTHWVAVDDLNMSVEFLSTHFSNANSESDVKPGLTNFVLTPKSTEGIKQNGIKEKILHFLL
jgi:hypothetical protein